MGFCYDDFNRIHAKMCYTILQLTMGLTQRSNPDGSMHLFGLFLLNKQILKKKMKKHRILKNK